MFSYRHAFHAGNHADVLKHLILLATVRHLMRKDAGITFVDTHAGAGLYRLDSDHAEKAGEAAGGIMRLITTLRPADGAAPPASDPLIDDYLDLVADFNPDGVLRVYPGSPFVIQRLLRPASRDRLRLFELHPTDGRLLAGNASQLEGAARRAVTVTRQDGFEGLKSVLPPPPLGPSASRRALVLIDPSYEIKTDYARVAQAVQDALRRFATGHYLIWYPIIGRPEAHDLPRRLRQLAQHAGRPWLHATLNVGHQADLPPGARQGLTASGMFVINPPYTLEAGLRGALPLLRDILGRGRGQAYTLDAAG
jgi:23S rRNA (adenine2030-N6)-methyltransferase